MALLRPGLAALTFLTVTLLPAMPAIPVVAGARAAAVGMVARDSGPLFVVDGNWKESGVDSPLPGGTSWWTDHAGDTATWKPIFSGPVRAHVFFYRFAYNGAGDSDMRIEIRHNGKTDSRTVNGAQPPSDWVDLGDFDWAGGPEEWVRLARGPKGGGATRITALRFDVAGEDGHSIISSLTLDKITAGPLSTPGAPPPPAWDDIPDPDQRRAVNTLGGERIIEGVSLSSFMPSGPARGSLMARWLLRACGIAPEKATLAEARKMGLSFPDGDPLLTSQAAAAVFESARTLPLTNRHTPPYADPLPLKEGLLTRGRLAVALDAFRQAYIIAGPPKGSGAWRLSFDDEFNGAAVDTKVWPDAGRCGNRFE